MLLCNYLLIDLTNYTLLQATEPPQLGGTLFGGYFSRQVRPERTPLCNFKKLESFAELKVVSSPAPTRPAFFFKKGFVAFAAQRFKKNGMTQVWERG